MSLNTALTRNYLGVMMPLGPTATNSVTGTAPGQTLVGKKGVSNWIQSDGGGSTLIGGDSGDTFVVVDDADVVIASANSGINTILSWTDYYQLPANVQNLFVQSASGGMGVGNNLNDLFVAEGTSTYTLVAGTGNDVMIGNGSGDPSFDTGAGSTTFVIAAGDGNDVISNFVNGVDTVRLENYDTLTSFAAVTAAMTQVGTSVVLNLGGGETLTFENETVAAFLPSDFNLPAYLPNMRLMFQSNFNNFVTSPDGSVGWDTTGGAGWRTLSSNNEAEYYSDSSVGVNPFSVSNGVLSITASPGTNPLGLPYNSGIITTEGSFSAEYGFWQVTAELPAGAGLWPAIWLLPENLSWPPEIDILEGLQQNTDEIHTGEIWGSSSDEQFMGQWNYSGSTTTGFNTYGLDWEPDGLTWYFNGNEVFHAPAQAGYNQPMYLLINLAVGGAGSWPGMPTSASEFPATMQISSVQFFASANTTDVSGTAVQAAAAPVTIVGTSTPAGTVSAPIIDGVTTSPGSGTVAVGGTVTLTVAFSSAVTVTGGTPTLALNDGGSAIYQSGSGSDQLVFSYTVAAGQSTSDLTLAASNAFALNGATIVDGSGNNAVLIGANGYTPAGTLQINPAASAPSVGTTSDYITPGVGTFTDAQGNVYSIDTAENAYENGALIPNGDSTGAMEYSNGTVYGEYLNTGDWYTWNQSTWVSAATAPPSSATVSGTSISSITASPGSGTVTANSTVTLTVTFSAAVTVAGGTPSLALNDGGTATYQSGSGSSALIFTYIVAAGQNTADLALASSNAFALNGATVVDTSGNSAVLTAANGYSLAGTLQIDTTAPVISAITTSTGNGDLSAGAIVLLTVTFSGAVTVAGGTPSLALNDGGTATYQSGSGSSALVFTYTVAAGQNTADLALAAENALALNGATIRDASGNNAVLSAANGYAPAGTLQIDTTAPAVATITTSPGSGDVAAGTTVLLTVTFSEAVTVIGGKPSLALNDGGTATYQSGSGSSALVFSYTVTAGQNISDLALAASNALVLNGATIRDGAGNNAVLTGANGYTPTGTLTVGATAPVISTIALSPGSGEVTTGSVVTVTVGFSESVTVAGGTPSLALNDGGTATYESGSGSANLVFDYTVASGQTTAALALSLSNALALNGATIVDGSGNNAVLTGANGYTPAGALQVNPATVSTALVVSGWGETYNPGAGTYNVSGSAGGAQITLGDGNQNVNITGINNTIDTGDGNETMVLNGNGNTVVTGAGASSLSLVGSYETVTVGATPFGTTNISAIGFGEQINSTGTGNIVVTGPTGNSIINLGDGSQTVTLDGSGNQVTVGFGTSTIDVGIGQGTVHTAGGSATIYATGYNNLFDAGPGMNFLHGGSGDDTFLLNGAGQGVDTIFGFELTIGDKLDLTRTLSSVGSTVNLTNVGSYITASTTDGNTTLYVDPTGGQGTPTAFASLQGVSATVAELVAHGDLIVP